MPVLWHVVGLILLFGIPTIMVYVKPSEEELKRREQLKRLTLSERVAIGLKIFLVGILFRFILKWIGWMNGDGGLISPIIIIIAVYFATQEMKKRWIYLVAAGLACLLLDYVYSFL